MRPLDGYPQPFGASLVSVFPTAGPSSYVVVTYGPLAGGDSVEAREAGLKYFDKVFGGVSDSGNFRVDAIPVASSIGPNGQQSTTFKLQWWALRTAAIGGQNQTINTEAVVATDLSGETVRLMALGPK